MKFAMSDSMTFKVVVTINVFLAVAWLFITQSFATYVFFIALSAISLWLIRKWDRSWLWIYIGILSVSLLFVVFVYFGNMAQYANPYYVGGSDDLTYETRSLKAMEENWFTPMAIQSNVLDQYDVGSMYYSFLAVVAFVAKPLSGYSTWLGRTLNVFLLIYSLMLIHYLILAVNPQKNVLANVSVLLIAVMPIMQYVNSHVFRDPLNLFLVLLIVALTVKIIYGSYNSELSLRMGVAVNFAFLLFSVASLYFLRRNTLLYPLMIVAFIIFDKHKLWLKEKVKYWHKQYRLKLFVTIAAAAVISVLAVLFIIQSRFINFSYYLDFYTKYKQTQAIGGLSYFIFDAPLLPMGIILRSFYAFISPFPSFSGALIGIRSFGVETVMLVVSLGVGFTYLMLPYIFKRLIRFDWVANSFIVIFLSIILTTFTFRHMIFYYPFMMILGVDGWYESSPNEKKIYLTDSLLVGAVLLMLYFVLRSGVIGAIL